MGASDKSDRATAAEPVVSALRDVIPSASLLAAVAAYDAAVAKCPANKTRLGNKLCPRCNAGPGDNCWPSNLAADDFVRSVKVIIARGMSAGTAETAPQAQGEARQPGPQDAPDTPSPSVASNTDANPTPVNEAHRGQDTSQ